MKKTGVRKAQMPPFFRPDDCAKTGRKPTCRRGAGNETCGCWKKKKGRFSPKLPYHLASRSASTIAPERFCPFSWGTTAPLSIPIESGSAYSHRPRSCACPSISTGRTVPVKIFPYPGSQSQRKLAIFYSYFLSEFLFFVIRRIIKGIAVGFS
ncbi:hypothetical protein Cdeb_02672 [Caldibacillus debilis GB1]|uniref:Uncharacterized protein n=1 Tax=Caldibacillus debilis GB1 TaxID=1339248 RepID=A0A420VJP7_9BACI|nr:hypothetical protein Cdeb_02672 [Caldibacillus debilis GB1]